MDRTTENIGRISTALYGSYKSIRLANDTVRKKQRFLVEDDGQQRVLTVADITLTHMKWPDLEPFVTEAIAALRRGALEVAVRIRGVRIVAWHGQAVRGPGRLTTAETRRQAGAAGDIRTGATAVVPSTTRELILDRVGGNLATGSIGIIGPVSGTLFDKSGTALPFSFNVAQPATGAVPHQYLAGDLATFEAAVPAGTVGWMKMAGDADIGLLGAVINFNANANAQAMS